MKQEIWSFFQSQLTALAISSSSAFLRSFALLLFSLLASNVSSGVAWLLIRVSKSIMLG